MKKTLIEILQIPDKLKKVATKCKKIIFSNFVYLSENVHVNSTIDYKGLADAVKENDQDRIEEIVQLAMENCYAEIEQAIEKVNDDKMLGYIDGAKILAILAIHVAVVLRSQDNDRLISDFKESNMYLDNLDEAYYSLVAGTLESIYALSISKREAKKEKTQVKVILN